MPLLKRAEPTVRVSHYRGAKQTRKVITRRLFIPSAQYLDSAVRLEQGFAALVPICVGGAWRYSPYESHRHTRLDDRTAYRRVAGSSLDARRETFEYMRDCRDSIKALLLASNQPVSVDPRRLEAHDDNV